MRPYQEHFGKNFNLGFNLKHFPFLKDESYPNDACPNFQFTVNDVVYILWVDYENSADQEMGWLDKYSINELETGLEVISSETFGPIKEELEKMNAKPIKKH